MTENEIIEWSNYVKDIRETEKEPVPLRKDMMNFLSVDELYHYLSKIKHLKNIELNDSEAYYIGTSFWSQIIIQVKK